LPNATFAQSVADQFDNIPLNGVPPIFQPSGVASAGDLQAVENNTIATNEQITAIQAQAPLFANNGALLRSLDSAANPGGPLDGNVGNSDLKAWLSSYKLVTENGTITQPSGSPFTKANAQFVQDILNGKYNGQDEGLNSAGFQVDQLGKAGAYGWDQNFDGAKNHGQDYNDLVKSYSDRSASLGYPVASTSDAPAPTPAPTDSSSTAYKTPPVRNAAGQTAQITLNDGRKDSFTYDSNGDISQIEVTNSDGTTSTLKPDAKGVWNGLTADGKGVTDVAVSKDGHIVFKDSSGQFSTVLPGGATQVLSSADQATLKKALKPYQSTSVETGDGYLRVAARVLGIQDTDNSKVGALANELESALHNQVLQPNQVIDLSDIVDPYLHALMDNSEQNAINKINI
ncbi:MAG TPA: hypothetical protein V6C72_04890, partial [Chroococcales cyanobacterium]